MSQQPLPFYRSLRWQLSALLVFVIATAGLLQLFFSTRGWRTLVEQIEQQINWDLAGDIAVRLQPALKNSFDPRYIEPLLLQLTVSNPKAEFVFLDQNGKVIAAIPYRENIADEHVDLEPIYRALEPDVPPLPLYGTDPFNKGAKKIFSVARVVLANQPGYLYIPLMSSTYEFFVRNTGQVYLARIILLGFILSWLFALAAGFALFSALSRRFRLLSQTIGKFQSGDLDARVKLGRDDELTRLSGAFNSMAETISANTVELRRKDALRREMIANISHDLRGPVTSSLAHLEALRGMAATDKEYGEYLTILEENAQSQNQLVEDLFDLSVLEANEGRMNKDYCSLQRIAASVVRALTPAAEKKSLSLDVTLPDELPLIYADSRAIQRVISNLVSNAIRYTPERGTVRIAATPESHLVRLTVSDSGIGIPAADLPFIFDSFYRANKHRPEDPGGTGLGLAIVKRLLALHYSEPEVTSVVDQGTTFSFTLPTEPSEDHSESPPR